MQSFHLKMSGDVSFMNAIDWEGVTTILFPTHVFFSRILLGINFKSLFKIEIEGAKPSKPKMAEIARSLDLYLSLG